MPPAIALSLCIVLVLGLFYFDPAKVSKGSVALWVPTIWIFLLASRPPSLWLGGNIWSGGEQALEQGDPLNRTVQASSVFAGGRHPGVALLPVG